MANRVEQMDVDSIESDFDNKENTFCSNVLNCTEKGYEELDVSELNMKLRYSVTPAASPMSKSFTNFTDNRNIDPDDTLNNTLNDSILTRSLNSTMTRSDNVLKTLKTLPLQSLSHDQTGERNTSAIHQRDSTVSGPGANFVVTVNEPNDDDTLSLPSSSSSVLHTPEATTPTKDPSKNESDSPIMRGLKSVLNMFRSSQSPIPPGEIENPGHELLSKSTEISTPKDETVQAKVMSASSSTPIAAHHSKESSGSRRNSPYKDSIVFNDDLEKELQWKDETTIIFSQEKIPVHKLFLQSKPSTTDTKVKTEEKCDVNLNCTTEAMDISYNDVTMKDKTLTEMEIENCAMEYSITNESDSEFVDCETTFSRNEMKVIEDQINTEHEGIVPNGETENNIIINKENNFTSNINELVVTNVSIENNQGNICIDNNTVTLEDNDEKELKNITKESTAVSDKYVHIDNNISTLDCNDENKYNDKDIHKSVANEDHEISHANIQVTSNISTMEHNDKGEFKDEIDIPSVVNDDCTLLKAEINIQNSTVILEQTDSKEFEESDKEHQNKSIGNKEDTHEIKQFESVEESQISNEVETSVVKHDVTFENINKVVISTEDILDSTNNAYIRINNHVNETEKDNKPLDIAYEMPIETIDIMNVTNTIDGHVEANLTEHIMIGNDPILTDFHSQKLGKEVSDIEIKDIDVHTLKDNIIEENSGIFENKQQSVNVNIYMEDEIIQKNQNIDHKPDVEVDKNVDDSKNILQVINHENKVLSEVLSPESDQKLMDLDILETVDHLPGVPNLLSCKNTAEVEIFTLNDKNLLVLPEIVNTENTHSIISDETKVNNTTRETDISESLKDCKIISEETNSVIESGLPLDIPPQEVPLPDDEYTDNSIIHFARKSPFISKIADPDLIEDVRTFVEAVTNCMDINTNSALKVSDESVTHNIVNVNELCVSNDLCQPDPPLIKEHINVITANDEVNIVEDVKQTDVNITTLSESAVANTTQDLCVNVPTQTLPDIINESISINTTDENMVLPDNIVENVLTPNKDEVKKVNDFDKITFNGSLHHENENKNDDIENNQIQEKLNYNEIDKNCEITEIMLSNDKIAMYSMHNEIVPTKESDADNNENIIASVDAVNITVCEKTFEQNYESNESHIIQLEIPFQQEIREIQELLEAKMEELDNEKDKNAVIENVDEEIIMSENSSPYVSVATNLNIMLPENDVQQIENIEVSNSPPITSKGYNFNFDDIEDPFATKTRVRMSPTLETPQKVSSHGPTLTTELTESKQKPHTQNRRKSLQEKRRAATLKKSNNKSPNVCAKLSDQPCKTQKVVANDNINNETFEETKGLEVASNIQGGEISVTKEIVKNEENSINEVEGNIAINICTAEDDTETLGLTIKSPIKTNDVISSEQNTSYSGETTSNDIIQSKNVFNLPEIDDMNFNPFATKSKIRLSPPPHCDSTSVADSKINMSLDSSIKYPNAESEFNDKVINTKTTLDHESDKDKMDIEPMEKDTSANLSGTTVSSKNTDTTTKEIHTEDEDTIEGPFLEGEEMVHEPKLELDHKNDIDMINFNSNPVNEADAEGELFIDAEAFEFLLNQNKSNVVSDSGKESLFLKFDPLFAKRISSESVVAALCKIQKRQSTPVKTPKPPHSLQSTNVAGPSNFDLSYEKHMTDATNEDLNVTVTKPTMVVTPAVNPIPTPRKSMTPTRPNRRSVTFTSPAMAVIDRLLSMSANNSIVEQDTTIDHYNTEQREADLALSQLRELLAEKEIHVCNLRAESKDLKDRLSTMESQMKGLEVEGLDRLKKINDLTERLAEKTQINKSMATVVEEYERTIASLIAETEQDKKRHAEERLALMSERDEQTAHLASMEVSFNDLHSKYEKSKQVILSYKTNEEAYKNSLKEMEENVTKMQTNYELLKQHATSKLNHANDELQKLNRAHEAEVLKLNAMIKRKELHITSLEETLAQKTKANEELTAICDELINKVG